MNKRIRNKWVEVLRSDRFLQGKNALKKEHHDGSLRHCCLGVLCEIAVEENIIDRPIQPDHHRCWRFDRQDVDLPASVATWAELVGVSTSTTPWVTVNGEKASLITHNDSGATFKQIADGIERDL